VSMDPNDPATFMILLSVSQKSANDVNNPGRTNWYANGMSGAGQTVSYMVDTDYTKQIGNLMKVSFNNSGVGTLSNFNYRKISGTIDKNNRTIGGHQFMSGAKIIEISINPLGKNTTANVVDFSQITATTLSTDQCIDAEISGTFGDISLLVVQNLVNSQYTYGLIIGGSSKSSAPSPGATPGPSDPPTATQKPGNPGGATTNFTALVNGVQTTISSSNIAYAGYVNAGVALTYNGNSITNMSVLMAMPTSGAFSAVEAGRIKVGNTVYPMDPSVQIYKQSYDYSYTQLSVADLQALVGQVKYIRLYADKDPSNGGLVRVIYLQ